MKLLIFNSNVGENAKFLKEASFKHDGRKLNMIYLTETQRLKKAEKVFQKHSIY